MLNTIVSVSEDDNDIIFDIYGYDAENIVNAIITIIKSSIETRVSDILTILLLRGLTVKGTIREYIFTPKSQYTSGDLRVVYDHTDKYIKIKKEN